MQKLSRAFVLAAAVALCYTATSWAVAPKIVCGALNPGHAAVSWSGDTAIGTAAGASDTCDQVVVFYNWNYTGWTTTNTYQASPGQTGHLSVQVGDSNLNYCNPPGGLMCSNQSDTDWQDPNGTSGCTTNCSGGGGGSPPATTFYEISSDPVPYNTSAQLGYTFNAASSCTVNGQPVPVSGPQPLNYSTPTLTQASTFTLVCTGQYGQSAPKSVTVNVQAQGGGGGSGAYGTSDYVVAGGDSSYYGAIPDSSSQVFVGGSGSQAVSEGICDLVKLPSQSPVFPVRTVFTTSIYTPKLLFDCYGLGPEPPKPLHATVELCFLRDPNTVSEDLLEWTCKTVGDFTYQYPSLPYNRFTDNLKYTCVQRSPKHFWGYFAEVKTTWDNGAVTDRISTSPPSNTIIDCAG